MFNGLIETTIGGFVLRVVADCAIFSPGPPNHVKSSHAQASYLDLEQSLDPQS